MDVSSLARGGSVMTGSRIGSRIGNFIVGDHSNAPRRGTRRHPTLQPVIYGDRRAEAHSTMKSLENAIHIVINAIRLLEPSAEHVNELVASLTLGVRSLRTLLDRNALADPLSIAEELFGCSKQFARVLKDFLTLFIPSSPESAPARHSSSFVRVIVCKVSIQGIQE